MVQPMSLFFHAVGQSLNIGTMKKPQKITPQLTCPKVLVLRQLIQHRPLDIVQRQSMSAAFQKYGDYVMKCQLHLDNLLPHEPRGSEEIAKAKDLERKVRLILCCRESIYTKICTTTR